MLATNIVVGIFISPLILHHLGDGAFGIWVLIFSITGYYGLFDLGIRSSVLRYVSRSLAQKDHESLCKVINTGLFSYGCIGALTVVVTLALAPYLDNFFHIAPEFHDTARWLLLMVGASVALGFPAELTGSLLEGLQRFDIINATGIAATLVRAVLIVVAVHYGRGLLTIALITVAAPLATSLIRGLIVQRLCPLNFGLRYVDRATFRQMATYSGITFMTIVAGRLKFKTDEIIIGSMMSAAAITYFNIGARIVDYAGSVVLGVAQVFLPMSSHSEAIGSTDGLRRIFVVGNRLCSLVMFPICASLLILGRSIIEVWVGKRYIAASYPVLVIMILATTLMWAQGASTRILFGIGKHGTLAVVTLIEGISNVILSVLLVRPYGIVGDAIGTAIPLFCTMVFFMPRHLCRHLGVRLSSYLRQTYTLPVLLCVPLVIVMLLMKAWFEPHTYLQLGFHLTVAGLIYGASLAWAFTERRLTQFSVADATNGVTNTDKDQAGLAAPAAVVMAALETSTGAAVEGD
jgi:O-antigen/teichoic acid export membrane protein